MTNAITWAYQEDEDHLGSPVKKAIFDMPNIWDEKTDPHPNTKLADSFMDFGKKYISIDPTGRTGYTANEDTFNTTKETNFNFKVPDTTQPVETPRQSTNNLTWIKPDSNITKALDAINESNTLSGTATGDFTSAIGGQYLKRGNHSIYEEPNRAESTSSGDLIGTAAKALGRAIIDSGGDAAQHDSPTDYNLHYSQNPKTYREEVGEALNNAGNAWMRTDTEKHRKNIETYGNDVSLGVGKNTNSIKGITVKAAVVFNEALTVGADKYENRETLAHEIRRNRFEWEDRNAKMMTPKDIRTDTSENYANDMFKYLYQTGVSQHFVNLALVRAYRGAPFMMQDAVNILDASFDIWADNIVEKGDYSYLNALNESIEKNHSSTNDVLINSLAKFMGGVNGDALMFLWSSMKENEKQQMIKELKQKQNAKHSHAP